MPLARSQSSSFSKLRLSRPIGPRRLGYNAFGDMAAQITGLSGYEYTPHAASIRPNYSIARHATGDSQYHTTTNQVQVGPASSSAFYQPLVYPFCNLQVVLFHEEHMSVAVYSFFAQVRVLNIHTDLRQIFDGTIVIWGME